MTTGRDDLAQAMAALVDDVAMAVPFEGAYGDRLANVVRKHLRELGRRDLAGDEEEVRGLVWDVVLLLHDAGAGWDPAGALPWSWAHRPIRSLVASAIGHARADVDPDVLDEHLVGQVEPPASGGVADFDELADAGGLLGLYRDALGELGVQDLHRRAHREYRIQKGLGDPSPSKTVAAELGLGEANVRQIDRRVRLKLAELVAAEPRFAPLRCIPWLDLPTDPHPSSTDSDDDGTTERAA